MSGSKALAQYLIHWRSLCQGILFLWTREWSKVLYTEAISFPVTLTVSLLLYLTRTTIDLFHVTRKWVFTSSCLPTKPLQGAIRWPSLPPPLLCMEARLGGLICMQNLNLLPGNLKRWGDTGQRMERDGALLLWQPLDCTGWIVVVLVWNERKTTSMLCKGEKMKRGLAIDLHTGPLAKPSLRCQSVSIYSHYGIGQCLMCYTICKCYICVP